MFGRMKKCFSFLILFAATLSGCIGPGLQNSVNAEYWYDQGQRQFRDGRYDEAAVSLSRAEALAADNMTKALIYRDMARVYNASYNSLQEAAYMERAAEAFAMAGETREANRALLETGQAYYNMEEYLRAEGLYKSALFGANQDKDTLLEVRTLQSYAALCLVGVEDAESGTLRQDPVLALELNAGLGMGNSKRNECDAEWDHASLKDVQVGAALPWNVGPVCISPYVYCTEQVEHALREAAEDSDPDGHSFQWCAGVSVAASF